MNDHNPLQVDIKLLKRQDLVSVMSNMMKPAHDQVQIRVNMNSDEMDTFVFCLAGKKVGDFFTAKWRSLRGLKAGFFQITH